MWSIEVSSEASEEEIDQALMKELDFDYIRECVAKLRMIVERFGPFKDVPEKTDSTSSHEFTRTFDDKRGWICDELKSIDARRIWTSYEDQWNGYSWISSEYSSESSGSKLVQSYFIAERPMEQAELESSKIELMIYITYTDDEDDQGYFALDLFDLINCDEVSDQEIMGALAN